MKIEIKNIKKDFVSRPALGSVNLTINKGEFICLLGPSGCGKSTLINILAGLLEPSSGEIYFDNKSSNEIGKERAMVFQEGALFPWLTVIENVEFGMIIKGINKKEATRIAPMSLRIWFDVRKKYFCGYNSNYFL